jgi:hypothetical protein
MGAATGAGSGWGTMRNGSAACNPEFQASCAGGGHEGQTEGAARGAPPPSIAAYGAYIRAPL